jgi:tRNA dimethylallyltransferase
MIIVIGGPTCSGKSEFAKQLAKYYNAEIINGDAFQIYQGMDIGTAKPTLKEIDDYKMHLYSFVTPDFSYNVKNYQEDARTIIDQLLKNHKNIIIVGGTGLYIRAALYDYSFQNEANIDLSKYEIMGNEELFNCLKKIDPDEANKYHYNNRKRVMRSLQICLESGRKKSEIIASQNHCPIYDDVKFFAIDMPRDILYKKIDQRVDEMFENGFVNEVVQLIKKYNKDSRAFQAIGYKEIIKCLDGELDLNECKELIKKHTRNYAKRQITFFKNQFPTIWVKNVEDIIHECL